MNKYANNKNSKVRDIISAYMRGDCSPSLAEKIQGWLVMEQDEAEKDAALMDIFTEWEAGAVQDAAEVDEMFAEITARLQNPSAEHKTFRETTYRVPAKEKKASFRLNRKAWMGLAAAVVVVGGLAAILFRGNRNPEVPMVAISVPARETHRIFLPDGSEVRLKELSTLQYPENYPQDRKVILTGEALFEVTKGEKPFVLETGDVSITVLGTKFNVRNYEDEEEQSVALVEGSVAVKVDREEVRMTPETQLILNKENKTQNIEPFDEYTLLKINGELLYFDGIQLDEAFDRIKCKYGEDVIVFDNECDFSSINVNVNFNENEELEDVLVVLQTIAPVFRYEHRNDSLFISAINR